MASRLDSIRQMADDTDELSLDSRWISLRPLISVSREIYANIAELGSRKVATTIMGAFRNLSFELDGTLRLKRRARPTNTTC